MLLTGVKKGKCFTSLCRVWDERKGGGAIFNLLCLCTFWTICQTLSLRILQLSSLSLSLPLVTLTFTLDWEEPGGGPLRSPTLLYLTLTTPTSQFQLRHHNFYLRHNLASRPHPNSTSQFELHNNF